MKRSWKITTENSEHFVTVKQSLFGFVKIKIDNDCFNLGHVSIFSKRDEPFRVGDSLCMLTIARGGSIRVTSNDCQVEEI